MENAYTEIRTGRILPGFLSLVQNSGKAFGTIREAQARLAKALGIERQEYFSGRRILPRGKWGEKNDLPHDAFDAPLGIPCKPIRAWAMILQENKIRK
jgi:hypothetical protein